MTASYAPFEEAEQRGVCVCVPIWAHLLSRPALGHLELPFC